MLLFLLLVVIAVFVKDSIVRPFVGDVLAVIWLFLFIKTFVYANLHVVAIASLMLAYIVECAQYLQLSKSLNITNKALQIIIGSVFDWKDIIAYTIGFVIIEIFILRQSKTI